MLNRLLGLIVVTLLSAASAPAGERHALLIGVSHYPGLPADRSLKGPKNDVALLYRTLIEGGFRKENILVIADSLDETEYKVRIPTSGPPNRDNILGGFRALSQRVRPGDKVLVYLSGHGSYKPEAFKAGGATEDDGTDEIFLPQDIGRWNAENEAVDNEISDDDIGAQITPLIDRNAFVWLVVDTCHAGTAVRSQSDSGFATRNVSPLDLGIPATAFTSPMVSRAGGAVLSTPGRTAAGWRQRAADGGGFVAFYAVQPDQQALERPLGTPGQENVHGILSWSLVRALRSQQAASYRMLAQRIAANYVNLNAHDRNGTVTPLFDGDLGAPPIIFAGADNAWRIEAEERDLYVRAGAIDDVAVGTIIAVRPIDGQPKDAPLFHARINRVGVERGRFEIIEDDPEYPNRLEAFRHARGLSNRAELMEVLRLEASTFQAKIVELVSIFSLQVSMPSGPGAARIDAVIADLRRTPPPDFPVSLDWVEDGAAADIALRIADDRLWFASPGTDLTTTGPLQPFSLPLSTIDRQAFVHALRTMGRGRNLLRMAFHYGETMTARQLELTVAVAPGRPASDGLCPAHKITSMVPDDARPVDATALVSGHVRLSQCDRVYVRVTNRGPVTVALTPLYVDPWLRTIFFNGYEGFELGGLRLPPGQARVVSWTERPEPAGTRTLAGPVKLVLIAVEVPAGTSYVPDFRDLRSDLPLSRQIGNGAKRGALFHSLATALAGNGLLRSDPDKDGHGGVIAIGFDLLPTQPAVMDGNARPSQL